MRTEEFVSRIYEISEKVSQILSYEYRGKTVGRWIATVIQYSFIVWIGLAVWKGYQYYLQLQQLQQQLDRKQVVLKNIQNNYISLQRKLKEINSTYDSISKIFSKKKVVLLKRKINMAFEKLKKEKFIVSPIKYEGFNYPFMLDYKFFSSVKGISLSDFPFWSEITERFKSSLNSELRRMWQSRNQIKLGTIELTLRGNKILMYYTKKGNTLKLIPQSYVGFVKSIYQTKGFLQATFLPYGALKNDLSYSSALVGWDFSLR